MIQEKSATVPYGYLSKPHIYRQYIQQDNAYVQVKQKGQERHKPT